MVYIGRDGQVLDRRPWSIERVLGIFLGFFGFIMAFFRTLLAPLLDNQNNGPRSWGGGGGGGGGFGGGGGGGPGRGNGPRPNRRIGRIMTIPDCTVPGGG